MNTSKAPTAEEIKALIESIAKEELHIETLKTRNRDNLDFYDVAVWNVQRALTKAFHEGVKAMVKAMPPAVQDEICAAKKRAS